MEKLPAASFKEKDRDEGKDDDEHRGENCRPDRLGGVDDNLKPPPLPLFVVQCRQPAVAVLDHDHPCIHQFADGDGDAAEGHDIGRDAEILHDDEGDEHRNRQGEDDHQGRPEVEQEDEDHQRYDDGHLDERRAEGADCTFNKIAPVVGDADFHPRRQPFFQRGDLRLDSIDNILGILSVPHDDDAAHHFPVAVEVQEPAPDCAPRLHRSQVLHIDGHPPFRGDDDVLQVRQRLDVAAPTDQVLGGRLFQ